MLMQNDTNAFYAVFKHIQFLSQGQQYNKLVDRYCNLCITPDRYFKNVIYVHLN